MYIKGNEITISCVGCCLLVHVESFWALRINWIIKNSKKKIFYSNSFSYVNSILGGYPKDQDIWYFKFFFFFFNERFLFRVNLKKARFFSLIFVLLCHEVFFGGNLLLLFNINVVLKTFAPFNKTPFCDAQR